MIERRRRYGLGAAFLLAAMIAIAAAHIRPAAAAGAPDPNGPPPPPTADMDELAFRRQAGLQVAFPYEDKDIDAEERKLANLRDNKLKTPSGVWQQLFYYNTLAQFGCSWNLYKFDEVLARWRVRHPQSPAPTLIAAAVAECKFKLDRRMVGINMQPRPGEPPVEFRLDNGLRAWKALLVANSEVAGKDPHYWLSLIRVMSYQREPLQQIMLALEEATKHEPTYQSLYFEILDLNSAEVTPQQVEALANYAVRKTHQTDGEGMYARVYWSAYQTLYGPAMLELPSLDWARMKAGMHDVLARHPDAWNLNTFALLACLHQDQDTGRDLMRRVGDTPYLAAWGDVSMFNACRDWVSKPL